MVDLPILPRELPPTDEVGLGDVFIVDKGTGGLLYKVTAAPIVNSIAPVATQTKAIVGTDDNDRMTPLKTKQSISSEIGVSISSYAAGQAGLSAVQPTRQVATGTGLTGGGDLSANRTVALNTSSIDSLALADTSVQPARSISAGSGLSGGGDLSADRSLSLSTATQTSLGKADSAIQAPGGSTGQVLTKNSATDGDVAWQTVDAATAVSYGPQSLNTSQKKQARDNIDASPKQTVSITAITSAVAYVDVTMPSNFESFELILNYVIPASSGVSLNMQFSTDNGSTFYTSTDYRYSAISVTSASAGTFLGASITTSIAIANDINNVHGFSTNVNIYPGSSAGRPAVSATTGLQASFGYKTQVTSGTLITVFQRITTIRVFCSTGNIASGRITLEGVRND